MSDDDEMSSMKHMLEQIQQKLGIEAPNPNEATVRQLWEEWEPVARQRKDWKTSVKSSKFRLLDMEITVGEWRGKLGDLQWSKCDHAAAKAWRNKRKAQLTIRGTLTAPKTRDRELASLHALFAYHVEEGRIKRNPLAGLSEEGGNGGDREGFYTKEQFELFIREAHPLLAKMARVSFTCGGMRRDEVRLLRESDLEWDEAKPFNERQPFIVIKGANHKNGETKRIPIPLEVYRMLLAQRDSSPRNPSGNRYLFPNPRDPRGEPLPRSTMGAWVERARNKSGLKLLGETPTFHHLRHSWAMHILDEGAPLPWVMDIAGWESVDIARKYSRLAGEKNERMRELMTRMSEQAPGGATPITKALDGERRGPLAQDPPMPAGHPFTVKTRPR